MNWLSDRRIGNRLAIAFAIPVSAVVIALTSGLISLEKMSSHAKDLAQDKFKKTLTKLRGIQNKELQDEVSCS